MKLHLVIAMGVALVAPALGSLREAAAQTQQNRKLMPKLPPDAPQDWARLVGWNEKLIKLHGRKLIIKFGSFETPGSITLDGRVLFKANQGDFVGFERQIRLRNGTSLILYYTRCAGSGCGEGGWKLIAIPKLGQPYKADLPEGNRHPVVRASSDRVEIDLGYYEGRRVRATFAKGKLQVNRALENKVAPLTSDDCRWVFDHLKLCAAADRRPSCNGSFDEISQEWAMASLRSLKMMEHNPRFSKSFANFCEDACGGTPKSDAEVGRAICGLGRAAADRLAEERLVARLANPISGAEFLADWRKLVGRTVSVAHCTLHDAHPNIETVSCAIIKGSTPVADIELRLNSGLSPPLDCAESKLTGRCSVTATGTVVEATGGKPGLSDASISR